MAQDRKLGLLLRCAPCTPSYCSLIDPYCLGVGESKDTAGKVIALRVPGCAPYTWQPMHVDANTSLLIITMVAT